MDTIIPDSWHSCYDLGWGKIPHPAAFSHPAKFSRKLIERIIDHALEEGWIEPGQIVIDPFGGTALGAWPCIQRGLNWTGCELEYHFQHLGQGFDCPGFSKATWRRYHGRAQRVYKGREDWLFCPDCAEAIDRIPEPLQAGGGQMSLFGRAGRVIPQAAAHRFKGNIERWREMFPHLPGRAVLLQGDSRNLVEVVGEAGCVVGSPPFENSLSNKPSQQILNGSGGRMGQSCKSDEYYGTTPGQLAALPPGSPPALVSSPPFAGNTGGRGDASRNGIDAALFDRHSGGMKKGTGSNPANLDHLPMGAGPVVVSSPPYAESLKPETDEQTRRKQERIAKSKTLYDGRNIELPSAGKAALGGGYGTTPGQLGAMKPGEPVVVSSPPYATGEKGHPSLGSVNNDDWGNEGTDIAGRRGKNGNYGQTPGQLAAMKPGELVQVGCVVGSPPFSESGNQPPNTGGSRPVRSRWNDQPNRQDGYGATPNQLGNESGDTFWAAARAIVLQCAAILPPGAAAIWVVKAYVKDGKRVDFPGQWQALCEACGFETVHIHRALLVKDRGEQVALVDGFETGATVTNLAGSKTTRNGNKTKNKSYNTARKSFFRLLHEAKQKAAQHWEQLTQADRTQLTMLAYVQTLENYIARLSEKTKTPRITAKRVIGTAQMIGWKRDGKPDYEIDTSVDYEVVLCMRRRG